MSEVNEGLDKEAIREALADRLKDDIPEFAYHLLVALDEIDGLEALRKKDLEIYSRNTQEWSDMAAFHHLRYMKMRDAAQVLSDYWDSLPRNEALWAPDLVKAIAGIQVALKYKPSPSEHPGRDFGPAEALERIPELERELDQRIADYTRNWKAWDEERAAARTRLERAERMETALRGLLARRDRLDVSYTRNAAEWDAARAALATDPAPPTREERK